MRSAVGGRNPGNPSKFDPLVGELPRFCFAGLAVNAMRVDLAVMNPARFLRKLSADVIAVDLDLAPHFEHRGTELRGRDRRGCLPRSAEPRRHDRLFDRGIAAFGASDLTRLLLRLEPVTVAKPALKLMALGTAQREQDHRHYLRTACCTRLCALFAIVRLQCKRTIHPLTLRWLLLLGSAAFCR